jgi:hypothetical protein
MFKLLQKNRLLFSLFILSFLSCQDLVYKKEITQGYYLIGVDTSDNISLCYKLQSGSYLGVLDSGIDRLGFNDKVIAVRAINSCEASEVNSKFKYYVIPLFEEMDEHWVDTLTIGPLTKLEFREKMKELDAGSVDFNIEI